MQEQDKNFVNIPGFASVHLATVPYVDVVVSERPRPDVMIHKQRHQTACCILRSPPI